MKKFLSLVMALIMTMSLVTVASAADYKDAADIDCTEAVEVMSAVGVFQGADGKFDPKATLTREQAAKLIAYLDLGEKTAEALPAVQAFSDVPATRWSAKYVAYCADAGYINGVGNGKFNPAGELTGYQFGKLLLCVLGYDATIEAFTGANWTIAVAKLMNSNDIDDGVKTAPAATLTREAAAQYCLNALKATTVEYADKGTQITINGAVIATGASKASEVTVSASRGSYALAISGETLNRRETINATVELGEKLYDGDLKLTDGEEDEFGRPGHKWEYKDADFEETYGDTADYVFTATTKAKVIAPKLKGLTVVDGSPVETKLGLTLTENYEITKDESDKAAEAIADLTGNGVVVEIFVKDDVIVDIVVIHTYLVKVTGITEDKTSTSADERAFTVEGIDDLIGDGINGKVAADKDVTKNNSVEIDNFDAIYSKIEEGDYVLVTLNKEEKAAAVALPTVVEGVVSQVYKVEVTIDGALYETAYTKGDVKVEAKKTAQKLYLDTNGYIMMADDVDDEESDVVYLVKVFSEKDKYGKYTDYAQIVTATGEVKELVLQADEKATLMQDEATKTGAYTYTLNSKNKADFTAASDDDDVEDAAGKNVTVDSAKLTGVGYFADKVLFVYVDGEGADLKVTTVVGPHKVTTAAGSKAVLNDDGEVSVVFIPAEANIVSDADDLLFALSVKTTGTVLDKDNEQGNGYTLYKNGKKVYNVVMDSAPAATGFYSYSVDEKTGRYTLTREDSEDGILTTETIKKDKFVTIDSVTDAVLAKDCAIYDLTDNECTTLKAVKTLVKESDENEFMFFGTVNEDDEFTAIYVVLTEEVFTTLTYDNTSFKVYSKKDLSKEVKTGAALTVGTKVYVAAKVNNKTLTSENNGFKAEAVTAASASTPAVYEYVIQAVDTTLVCSVDE